MFLGKTIADRARNQKRQWWDKKAKWSDKKWRSMNKDSAHRIFFFFRSIKHHLLVLSNCRDLEKENVIYTQANVLSMKSLLLPKEP